jgi:hypothetical protein
LANSLVKFMPPGAHIVLAGRVRGRCVWSWLVGLEEAVPTAIMAVRVPVVLSVSAFYTCLLIFYGP